MRDLARLHLWQIQAVRDALLIASLIGLVMLGYAMRSVTVPLLVALMLAYLIEPLVVWACARYKLRRPVVVSGMVISIAVVFVLCLAIAVPVVVGQTIQMVRDMRYGGRLERTFIALREYVPDGMVSSFDVSMESISHFLGTRYRPPKPRPSADADATDDAADPNLDAPDTDSSETSDETPVQPSDNADTDDQQTGDADSQPQSTNPDDPADQTPDGLAVSIDQRFESDHLLPPLTELEIRAIVRDEMFEQWAAHDVSVAQLPAIGPGGTGDSTRPAISSIWNVSRATVGAILGFLTQVLKIGFLFFLIPFYLFFFSVWFPDITAFYRSLIPKAHEKETLELLHKMDRVIAGFVRGRIVISMIIGVICAVGWWICGVPYAIVLGLITGIFSAVPYLGGIGLPIAILLLWVDQLGIPVSTRMSWVWIIGGPSLVFIIMQILETYIITPAIAGKATNLDPVTILVAVIAGGSIGGIYGMLLAIPAAACVKILLTDIVMPRVRLWVRGRAEDPLPL